MKIKIFERRMRISWPNFLIIGLPFTVLAGYALMTGHAVILRGRIGQTHHILKEEDSEFFGWLVCFYILVALFGYLFSFYRIHRESWFNT
jgi:uncharacterized membrane protein HdeD (DUF308 family)